MREPHLVLFDADRIRDYVFATGRLREIRGASEVVRQATAPEHIKQIAGVGDWQPDAEGLIYAAGGAGALVVDGAARAREVCAALERAYRRATGAATLSAAAVPIGADEASAQAQADLSLAARKQSRPRADSLPGGGPLRYCDSDRLYPASRRAHDPGSRDGILVSAATASKREASLEYRRLLDQNPAWEHFLSRVAPEDQDVWRNAVNSSQDLGDIGALARPRGYIAMVYVDGDGAGKALRQAIRQQGFKGYKAFSTALTTAAEQASGEALAAAYQSGLPHRRLPFELITIGGDDVVLICTAERGLAIAAQLCRRMAALVNERLAAAGISLEQPFSASAGVVIAHDSLPIVLLERRAYDLLRSAKRAHGSSGGGVDYYIVTTPGLEPITQIRERDYRSRDESTSFTARPFSLDQMDHLLHAARYLRGLCDVQGTPRHLLTYAQQARLIKLPGSKVADLYTACHGSRVQATLNVLTVHTRLGELERRAILQALRNLGSMKYYPFGPPNPQRRNQVSTALLDLLEALEFVAEEGTWTR